MRRKYARTGLRLIRKSSVFLLVLLLIPTLFSCTNKEAEETDTGNAPALPTVQTTTLPPAQPPVTQAPPLTDARPLFPGRFPIAFMINNVAAARPQSGLDRAKLIYQMMTEGRTTRLLLLTDAQEGIIGPVRSARPAYLDLVAQHQAFYCYAGNYRVIEASPLVGQIRILDALKGDYDIFYRTEHRVAPHNLYTTMESAYRRAERKYGTIQPEEPVQGLYVRDHYARPGIGERVTQVNYRYSGLRESFRYDPDRKVYHKYNDDQLLSDEQSGQPVDIANIIVLHRPHGLMPNGVHISINWIGQGEAVYLTGARKYTIRWEKTSHTDPIVYYLDDEELILNPGLTWIAVVDDSALASFEYR